MLGFEEGNVILNILCFGQFLAKMLNTNTCKLLANGKTQIHNKRLLTSLQRSKHLLKENLSKTSVSDRSRIKPEGEGEKTLWKE